jgi:hypothetical protein
MSFGRHCPNLPEQAVELVVLNLLFCFVYNTTDGLEMKTRVEIDALCWKVLEEKVPRPGVPPGYPAGPRPSNYAELAELIRDRGDFELAWGEFLHECHAYKSGSFFAVPPPSTFSPEHRAWLATCCEYLCQRFHLPIPAWVEEPEFFLPEEWDFASETFVWAGMLVDMTPYREERRSRSHDAFLRRGIIFEPRALIAL